MVSVAPDISWWHVTQQRSKNTYHLHVRAPFPKTNQDKGVVRNLLGCEPLVYFDLATPNTHVHAHEPWNQWPNASDLLQSHAGVLRNRYPIPRTILSPRIAV